MQSEHDGPSLVPLLKAPSGAWPHVAVTHLSDPGSYGLSTERWRLVHYANGEEELYDISKDPHEWTNLAERPEFESQRTALRNLGPVSFAPAKSTETVSQTRPISLTPWPEQETVVSRPQGAAFQMEFDNESESAVHLYWLTPKGEKRNRIEIPPAGQRNIKTRKGAAWLVTDVKDRPLGFFRIGNQLSKAVIPDF